MKMENFVVLKEQVEALDFALDFLVNRINSEQKNIIVLYKICTLN